MLFLLVLFSGTPATIILLHVLDFLSLTEQAVLEQIPERTEHSASKAGTDTA